MYKVHVFIGVLTCICQTATNGSETWFEAREACRSHNLTLQTNEIVGNATYWTGRYKKLSRWIHLLGCYSDQSFNESEKFHMPHRSVGLCEGICSSLNNLRHFAVKGSTCICLIGFVSTTHLTPKACDLSCDTDTRQPFANECGGSSAYNLYVSAVRQFGGFSKRCGYIQCSLDNKIYSAENCNGHFLAACEEKGNSVYVDWITAMSHCKSRDVYLFTNLTLEDADDDCNKVKSVIPVNTYGQIWISVGRQVYSAVDKGEEIRNEDYGFYKECEICFNQYCTFTTCDSKIQVSRTNCVEQDPEITKEPRTTLFTTSTPNITSTTTEIGITLSDTSLVTTVTTLITDEKGCTTEDGSMKEKKPTEFNVQEKEASENNIMISAFIPVVTVVVIGVVLAIFLLQRRQKSLKEMQRLELKPVTFVPDLGNDKSKCTASENADSACNKGMEDVVTEEETMYMYNDQREETYDHLGDSDSRRRKATEDVYHHANFTNSFGSSVYDFAGRSNKNELDDVYDHTNVQRGSDYASNVVQGTTVNCDYASIQT